MLKLGFVFRAGAGGGNSDVQWCFSQVKGAIDDDVAEGESMWWSLNICQPVIGMLSTLVLKLAPMLTATPCLRYLCIS